MRKHHNPERRDWRGRSYKKWGELIAQLKDKLHKRHYGRGLHNNEVRDSSTDD